MSNKNFYIFLDIDGVLFDWQWFRGAIDRGEAKSGGLVTDFNPQSIKALNKLCFNIAKDYNLKIVVSSTWREIFETLKGVLDKNGFKYLNYLQPLPKCQGGRAIEIYRFLQTCEDQEDYLILDDEDCGYGRFFDKTKFIHTSIFNHSLNMDDVDKFLDNLHKNEENIENY